MTIFFRKRIPYGRLVLWTIALIACCLMIISCRDTKEPGTRELIQELDLESFDRYIQKQMEKFSTPGLAIAIIKDDDIIFSKTYGFRDLETKVPLTEDTLFAVGSTGKSMTTAMIATLVDDGKLKWDDPVIKHLPNFKMPDDYVTREITIRDLLSMRTGLVPQVGLPSWYFFGVSYQDAPLLPAHYTPETSFRTTWSYVNLGPMIAGVIAEAVTGQDYHTLMQERLFQPTGMSATSTRYDVVKNGRDVATPYNLLNGKALKVTYKNIADTGGPAGAANSTLKDMSNYVRMYLNQGFINGKQVISKASVAEMMSPQTIIAPGREPLIDMLLPEVNSGLRTYGLALGVTDHHGKRLIAHGGQIQGFCTWFAMIPSEGIGYVAITNSYINGLPSALHEMIFNPFIGLEPKDVSDKWLAFQNMANKREAFIFSENPKETSLPINAFEGTYANPPFGGLVVKTVEGEERLKFTTLRTGYTGRLIHIDDDSFYMKWDNPTENASFDTKVIFHITENVPEAVVLESPLYIGTNRFSRVLEEVN